MDQYEGMTKPQNAHLRSASQQSVSSVRVPFSTICPFGGLSCWVQSLALKVQVSSTPTVSRHAFTLFAFEPITSSTKSVQQRQHRKPQRRCNRQPTQTKTLHLRRQAFFHISVGGCICQLEIKSHFKSWIQPT
jgi:hypothetical protein